MAQSTKSLTDRSPARPQPLPVIADGIPSILQSLPQWVCWRYVLRQDAAGKAKWTKVPVNAQTGRNAKVDDPGTWSTCAAALDFYHRLRDDLAGVGFVFTESDPFSGID